MTSVSYRDFNGTAAENYERYFVPAIATPVSVPFLRAAALRPGERVLDVACGTGIIARAAVRAGCSVTGIDVAPDMIDAARATEPTIDWHVGDAQALRFDGGTFDVVTCQMGLMFLEDRAQAVAEMRRVLAPGGRVVVSTPGAIQPFFEVIERAITGNIGSELGGFVRAVFSMPDPESLAALLRDAGLADAKATVEPATLRLPAPAEFLWQYINLTPMRPFVAAAPAEAQAAMERQMVRDGARFVAHGGVAVDQPMVIGTGRQS